jgi:formamidopyrimidine-DNA glycosylase
MPELPEVEAARRRALAIARGRRITRLWAAADPLVFEGVAPGRLRDALLGRRVRAVRRHGKHLWLELDRRPWLCLHFGMSGGLATSRRPAVRLVAAGRRPEPPGWPPRFTKLRLAFDDGGELAITDARRLGRLRLRDDPRGEPPVRDLGFDALHELPSRARFRALARRRAAPVKAVLLDQAFAAGVGNWVADEVLYQAGIDPRRPARGLSDAELDRLRASLRGVLRTAVRVEADSARFPRTWLFHVRWGRRAGARTARGERIRHDTVAGRTTAWVPAAQR